MLGAGNAQEGMIVADKQKLVGQNYTTPDLIAKVTGEAKFAEDYRADGMLFAKRMTFVVDKDGKIAWMDLSVNPSKHSQELQDALTKLH